MNRNCNWRIKILIFLKLNIAQSVFVACRNVANIIFIIKCYFLIFLCFFKKTKNWIKYKFFFLFGFTFIHWLRINVWRRYCWHLSFIFDYFEKNEILKNIFFFFFTKIIICLLSIDVLFEFEFILFFSLKKKLDF